MEKLLAYHVSLTFFLIVAGGLFGVYVLLKLAHQLLENSLANQRLEAFLAEFLRRGLVIYPPLAQLITTTMFIFLNLLWCGALVLLVMVLSIDHLRNYISGCAFDFGGRLQVGEIIVVEGKQGTITQKNYSGIYLMIDEGTRFINYQQLRKGGYTLVSSDDWGEYLHLKIEFPKGSDLVSQSADFVGVLVNTPYVNTEYPPQCNPTPNQPNSISAKVLLQKGDHVESLVALLIEQGYSSCTVLKSQ